MIPRRSFRKREAHRSGRRLLDKTKKRGYVMRALVSIAALGLLALPVAAHAQAPAQPLPEWAYPVAPAPKPPDATKPITLPGSTKQYTQAQIDNRFGPPDWYPEDHPPMPEVVATGRAAERLRLRAVPSHQRRRASGIRRHLRASGRLLPAPDGGVQVRHPQGHARRHHDPDRQGDFRRGHQGGRRILRRR